ncbi:MAG: fumarylacetoacetate hydrolase family protein [Chloroflexota bacterium]
MRLATAVVGTGPRVVVVGEGGSFVLLDDLVPGAPSDMIGVITEWERIGHLLADRSPMTSPRPSSPSEARLLAPIPRPRRNVFCVGWNYSEHFAEGQAIRGEHGPTEIPQHPALFTKNAAAVVGPDAPVWHPGPHSNELDWEVELAVVIGKGGRDIPEGRAMEHVFGYTIGNDVSVRDHQRTRHGGQWSKGKSFDTHCPLGPWIVTPDEIPDPHVLAITSRVNGETKQSSNTRHMVFTIPRIIAELSAGLALEPGDVILTGTPEGVGFARTPPQFLAVGDLMEMEIQGIGVLRNRIVEYGGVAP